HAGFATTAASVLKLPHKKIISPGKRQHYWRSTLMMRRSIIALTAAVALHAAPVAAADTSLDYGFYKASVEPIFLKKRPDHVRCYVCHSESTNAFKLEKLAPGSTFWSEEQSRQNFEVASKLV